MQILLTGATGFVGQHLLRELRTALPDARLYGLVRRAPPAPLPGDATPLKGDLEDPPALAEGGLSVVVVTDSGHIGQIHNPCARRAQGVSFDALELEYGLSGEALQLILSRHDENQEARGQSPAPTIKFVRPAKILFGKPTFASRKWSLRASSRKS